MEERPDGDASGLFRPEALAHRARQKGPGDVLRIAPRWVGPAFYLLVVLFAGALVAGLVIDVDRYVRGPIAIDDRGRVVVLLPAALAPDVVEGSRVEIGDLEADVVGGSDEVLYPPDVLDAYGIDVASPSVAVVTSAPGSSTRNGIARVLIASDPALVALIPGLDALLGGEGA